MRIADAIKQAYLDPSFERKFAQVEWDLGLVVDSLAKLKSAMAKANSARIKLAAEAIDLNVRHLNTDARGLFKLIVEEYGEDEAKPAVAPANKPVLEVVTGDDEEAEEG